MFLSLYARLYSTPLRLSSERGQGTVEYVALILLVAAVFTAVVAAGHGKDFGLTKAITSQLKDAIDSVKSK